MRRLPQACLFALLLAGGVAGQAQVRAPIFPPRPETPAVLRFLGPLFVPKVVQDCWLLRAYVRSEEFAAFRREYGDRFAVDALFDTAMRLAWNNVYEALLISLCATLDHRRFGIRLPLVGPLLWVPLTSEFEEDFEGRRQALPGRLFPDTPADGSDRDKLQHFFGSALLAALFESADAADRVGEFIEWGEEHFVVDGALDTRDEEANRRGQRFGLWLLSDDQVLPSRFFTRALGPH